jgi:hypothetical protein
MQRLLADNRLAEKAGWDREILAIELQALVSLDFEGPFAGSGTLMIAAERTGRRARALEIDSTTSTSRCDGGRTTPGRRPHQSIHRRPCQKQKPGCDHDSDVGGEPGQNPMQHGAHASLLSITRQVYHIS